MAKKEKEVKERREKEIKENETKQKEIKEKEERERKEKEARDGKEPIDMSKKKKKTRHSYGTSIDNRDSDDESMDEDAPGNLVIDSDAADNSFVSSNVTTIDDTQPGESTPKRSRIS